MNAALRNNITNLLKSSSSFSFNGEPFDEDFKLSKEFVTTRTRRVGGLEQCLNKGKRVALLEENATMLVRIIIHFKRNI